MHRSVPEAVFLLAACRGVILCPPNYCYLLDADGSPSAVKDSYSLSAHNVARGQKMFANEEKKFMGKHAQMQPPPRQHAVVVVHIRTQMFLAYLQNSIKWGKSWSCVRQNTPTPIFSSNFSNF
jgi:hypothetical protein